MKLKYPLEGRPPAGETLIFGIQWAAMILSSNIFLLLIVTESLGFSMDMTARFIQRSLVYLGVATLLQVYLGHKLTLFEVVASVWVSTFLFVASTGQGQPLELILQKLSFLQILTGLLMLLLATTGWLKKIQRFFTPTIMGVTLVLICIQMSSGMIRGMLGGGGSPVEGRQLIFSLILFLATLYIGFRGGRLQPFVGLIGLGGGWLAYNLTGLPAGQQIHISGFSLPQLFPYGMPVADLSLIPLAVFLVLIYLPNEFASINAVGDVVRKPVTDGDLQRAPRVAGFVHILSSALASIVVVPAAMGAGLIATTGVGARRTMGLGAIFLIVLGLAGPVGGFFAAIPPAVSYSVSLSIVARIMSIGLRNCFQGGIGEQNLIMTGVSMMLGAGIMFLPAGAFSSFGFLAGILGNGLLMGVLAAVFMENILLRKKSYSI